MKWKIFMFFILIPIENSSSSFWNEIPRQCFYDKRNLFSCSNTTFIYPIPLFNDLKYSLQNHFVDIRYSNFNLTLNKLLSNIASNIESLTLISNRFTFFSINQTEKIYFRCLESIRIYDESNLHWLQLNSSYFPRLNQLDLSYNNLTDKIIFYFNQQYYPNLKFINLSHNQLETINNLTGNILNRIEYLILSYNPLKTVNPTIKQFSSLIYLDLTSTLVKQLFSLTLLPRLETFQCQYCHEIAIDEYEKFLSNCSYFHQQLTMDLTNTNIQTIHLFNPYIQCMKNLTLNNQYKFESITKQDLLFSTNLETIQIRSTNSIDYIHLNVYDRLKSIDFSYNSNLKQVHFYLMSDFTYLQYLLLTNTKLNEFSISFNNTKQKYLHIDMIDMSYCYLERLDFLKYLTFYILDLSHNHLKIIDFNEIHFLHGMYELSLMNVLNFSSNSIESIKINWINESPHTIDLSKNNLQTIELHGQTTYTILLNDNPQLSLTPNRFHLDLPLLEYINLESIQLDSFENLIYLHNLTNIRTLLLDNNKLNEKYRTLNWNVFYPWHLFLTHISIQNVSLNRIEFVSNLNDYVHLLTIDLFDNIDIVCDCTLKPFLDWLKVAPPLLPDFREPLEKVLRINCPASTMTFNCKSRKSNILLFLIILISSILSIGLISILWKLSVYLKRKYSKNYNQMMMYDIDSIPLDETIIIEKLDEE